MTIDKFCVITKYIVLGIFIFVANTLDIKSQVNISPREGTTPSAFKKGNEAINPYNGNLTFNLPLLEVGGRGEAGYTISQTILQQLQFVHSVNGYSCNVNSGCLISHLYNPVINNTPGEPYGGINNIVSKPGYKPGIMVGKRSGTFEYTYLTYQYNWSGFGGFGRRVTQFGNNTPQVVTSKNALSRLYFTTNDGSEIEFRDALTDGDAKTGACSSGAFNRGKIFKSYDGSQMTFVSDQDISDWTCTNANPYDPTAGFRNLFTVSGYLHMKNGVVYRIDNGEVSWIRDRNGNKTIFSANTITDSNGRQIVITTGYDQTNGNYTQYSYKGTAGNDRNIKVYSVGLGNALISGQALKTWEQLFGGYLSQGTYNGNAQTVFSPSVISAVELPNGKFYRFYYNSYGELSRVEYPEGGAVEFEFDRGFLTNDNTNPGVIVSEEERQIYRRVIEKRVYPNGGTGNLFESKTTYSRVWQGQAQDSVTVEILDNNGNRLSKVKHFYKGDPQNSFFFGYSNPSGYKSFMEGREYKTEYYDADNSLKRVVEFQWQNRVALSWWNAFCYNPYPNAYPCGPDPNQSMPASDPILVETKTTLADTNQVSVISAINPTDGSIGFDQFNNQTDTYEFDYGIGQKGEFKRRIHTDFRTDTNYTSYTGAHLRSLPAQTWVSSDAAGTNKISFTQYEYDNYSGESNMALLARNNVVGHDTANYGINNTVRGNVTKVTSYANAQNQTESINVFSNYDILGNITREIDGNGNVTTIDYSDRFGFPDSEARSNTAPAQLNGQSTFAFPTYIINPKNWVTYLQYDYFNGKLVNDEDINNLIKKIHYNDLLDRPTQTVTAIGTSLESQSNIIYDDDGHRIETKSDLFALNDNKLKSEIFYDGLGRNIKTQSYESDGVIKIIETIPFVVIQDTETSIWRQGTKTSNPYRPSLGETAVWTTVINDSLGREIKTFTPEGSVLKNEYSGNTATIIDQAGNKRRSITNSLGHVTRVDEPNDAGQLEISGVAVQPTYYTYDAVGNLRIITQSGANSTQCGGASTNCSQTRTYNYDGLSRLKSATTPESGTVVYQYDANGNLISQTDARQVVTTSVYDSLNRHVSNTYSATTNLPNYQTTSAVTYHYDGIYYDAQNSQQIATGAVKGKLTSVSTSLSKTNYTSFDALGRVTSSQQITDGVAYNPMTYTYDLSGALVEQTYPSGRKVKNVYDQDGDLSIVQSKRNDSFGYLNYAKHFTYTASGTISSLQLGNGTWESREENLRYQPKQIALGTTQNSANLWKINYEFGELQNDGTVASGKNISNVAKQTITVPTIGQTQGFTAIQTFTYDSIKRLKTATEKINGVQTWKQSFNYDRYGNRRFDTSNGNTTTILPDCPTAVCNPEINPNTNRISDNQNYEFDNNGNVKQTPENIKFLYDANNKIVEARTVTTDTLISKNYYDASGKRVMTWANNSTTVFIFDTFGKIVAEYALNEPPNTSPSVKYLTADFLGSPRVITDAGGQVVSRRDFMPFGEEILANTAGRTTDQKYSYADKIRQKFTGQMRDEEVKLDYFNARHYSFRLGRFMSADIFGGKSSNPQTLNLYAYALNNPLRWVDPTGHFPDDPVCPECTVNENNEVIKNGSKYFLPTEYAGNSVDVKDLDSPFQDMIPVWGPFRQMIWNMKSNGGNNIDKALLNFGLLSFDLSGIGMMTRAYRLSRATEATTSIFVREVAEETLEETGEVAVRAAVEETANVVPKPNNCFVAGTLIHTEKGIVPIENIKDGDKVLSYNEETKRLEYQDVVRLFRNTAQVFLKIQIEGEAETIQVTLGHPFYVFRNRGNLSADAESAGDWVLSKSLQIGDLLKSKNGQWKPIVSIEKVQETQTTYNFEVFKNHDYFVGENGWLVHNQSFVDLTDFRRTHILNRHRSGAGKPGKSEFPSSWSDDKIINEISDVATDPNAASGMGPFNAPYVEGVRDGVKIRVDFYPQNHPLHSGKISTAYPTNLPKNP